MAPRVLKASRRSSGDAAAAAAAAAAADEAHSDLDARRLSLLPPLRDHSLDAEREC
jgi:hypothetical protein